MSSPQKGGASEAPPSSPLFFPSSSPAPVRQRGSDAGTPQATPRARLFPNNFQSSPLAYESSSPPPPASRTTALASDLRSGLSQSRENGSATPRQRRGDIHSSGLLATPIRRRLVVDGSGAPKQGSDAAMYSQHEGSDAIDEPTRVIWGTNVGIQETMASFKGFLQNFKQKYRMVYDSEFVNIGEGEALIYEEMLQQMRTLGTTNLNLDVQNLKAYPPTKNLYSQLLSYPQEIIPIMDQSIKDCLIDIVGDEISPELTDIETKIYKVRPFGICHKSNLRDLNPSDIDKLVKVKGLVIRATPIIPDMKQAFFKCSVCNHSVTVEIDRGRIAEPTRCPRELCKATKSMQLIHNRSEFADKQVIKLQETPDTVPDGQTPHSVALCVYDELVDVCKAGDRIEATGIFRSVPVRINPMQRSIKSLFKTYIDVVHIQKASKSRLAIDTSTLECDIAQQQANTRDVEEVRRISPEEIEKIHAIANRYDVYEILARSLAPSIYEMDDVKKGLLLQLFGGTNKDFKKGGSPRYRGDINILLCGDPSTSKSQLLQYVHKIAPRGVYTSGKGSSAVGLTAYITRDQDTRQLVLESGALVLSDGGICCIDEFDKMSDATRSVLHEVMEQQTISIAKAGIITTLNARSSILASANPIGSKYNPNLPVPQNIDLPPTLLSRFDLVYLILDKIDEAADRRLAKHLVGMYIEDAPETADSSVENISIELLTSYISYAKQNIKPVITTAASEELIQAYSEMRKMGEDVRSSERRITATTRQLESLIRLSEAHAKMRLSQEVEVFDVKEATRLIRTAIKDYATDPITGRIDLDLIQTGTSMAQRRARVHLRKEVLLLLDQISAMPGANVRYPDLAKKLGEQSQLTVEPAELNESLRVLESEGHIKIQGEGSRRTIRRMMTVAT